MRRGAIKKTCEQRGVENIIKTTTSRVRKREQGKKITIGGKTAHFKEEAE